MVGDTRVRATESLSKQEVGIQNRLFLRWAGWSGLAATVAFIATILMNTIAGVAGPESADDMVRAMSEVSDGGATQYYYGIAGVAMVVLYIPMAVGLFRYLRRTTLAWYGSLAVIAGLGVLLPAYVINLATAFGLAPLTAELGASAAEALYADYEMARASAELFFAVGSVLTLAFGPLLWGIAWVRSRAAARWLGWTGVLTGLTGLVWFVWLAQPDTTAVLLIGNVLLSLVLFAGMSVVMVVKAGSASGTDLPDTRPGI